MEAAKLQPISVYQWQRKIVEQHMFKEDYQAPVS